MTDEDEGFNEMEKRSLWRKRAVQAAISTTQPQRTEPVCPECKAIVLYECVACSSNNYPPQRTWVGLTKDEQSFVFDQVKQIVDSKPFWVRFADAIEAKLKEKNS